MGCGICDFELGFVSCTRSQSKSCWQDTGHPIHCPVMPLSDVPALPPAHLCKKTNPTYPVLNTRQPRVEGGELINISNTQWNEVGFSFSCWFGFIPVEKWRVKEEQLKVQTLSSRFFVMSQVTIKILMKCDHIWGKQVSLGLKQLLDIVKSNAIAWY